MGNQPLECYAGQTSSNKMLLRAWPTFSVKYRTNQYQLQLFKENLTHIGVHRKYHSSVAFCSPANRLTFSGLMGNSLVGKSKSPNIQAQCTKDSLACPKHKHIFLSFWRPQRSHRTDLPILWTEPPTPRPLGTAAQSHPGPTGARRRCLFDWSGRRIHPFVLGVWENNSWATWPTNPIPLRTQIRAHLSSGQHCLLPQKDN